LPADTAWVDTSTDLLYVRVIDADVPVWREAKEIVFWDDRLPGFGLRVRPHSQTFIAQGRVSGKTVKVKLGVHTESYTPESARIAAKDKLGDLAKDTNPNAEKKKAEIQSTTLGQLFEAFKKDRTLRPKTLSVYGSALNRCFSAWLDKPALNITEEMVLERQRKLSLQEGPRSNKGGMKAQANQAMRVLRTLLNYSAGVSKRAKLPAAPNPVLALKENRKWNKNKRRRDIIEPHRMAAWYREVSALRYETTRDYLLVCLFGGLRRSECATLEFGHIDLEGRWLNIAAERTKTDEQHGLPLPDVVYKILLRRSKLPRNGNDYVFPAPRPNVKASDKQKTEFKAHIMEPKTALREIERRAGFEQKIGMHTLRRTFATTAQDLGVPYLTLKRLLNHKPSGGDVTEGYTNLTRDMLREPMQRIADRLSEQLGIGDSLDIDECGKLIKTNKSEEATKD